MFENPRRGRQARNFATNVPKILDLKSSSEQICFRKLSLGARDNCLRFLLGRLKYPGEIGNNSYAKFWAVNKVHYGVCENSELPITLIAFTFYCTTYYLFILIS